MRRIIRAWRSGDAGSRPRSAPAGAPRKRTFTLAELLVVTAIVAVLTAVLLPGLGAARAGARRAACGGNLTQLARAFHMYAGDHRGRAMPLAYTDPRLIGDGPAVYWWGTNDASGVDHTRGFVWPYLRSDLRPRGVYECPEQPWGTYVPQGAARQVTSTYGYNGYFFCPPHTPGWSQQIGRRPWQNVDALRGPQRVFAFADAAADLGADLPHNNALLDPPFVYRGDGRWTANATPTTSFRHARRTMAAHADGHVAAHGLEGGRLTSPRFLIGSVGAANDPCYVPDWRDWRE